ncbi:GntR family transcriptional regulator [Aureimonas fodinaquatilis]|uniref:GntR family transcriptional regulator n=1 Tax=Aureimonas fodinaquatilis TaxID=2565783 RepID=A0A5B0E1F8_9HYPH|nr:GntR family transcriptional regulator [Aureimonas fodinaquatilis]KAA0972488.1 GntR family transcriptional regulator [Aureimonas fodinaquatilis]
MSQANSTIVKPVGKTIKHRTISSAVADQLRQQIVAGELKAGMQLRQDTLAATYGVSRIPVREALMQLESEGLVKIAPHRGAVVSALSVDELEEVFSLRLLLEPRLLKSSAPHLTVDDYRNLDLLLAEYSHNLDVNNVQLWGELNTKLHMLLYSHAAQPRSSAIILNLLQESDRHTRLQLMLPGAIARARDEHGQIVELCRSGKIKEACILLKAHIEYSGRSLAEYLGSR